MRISCWATKSKGEESKKASLEKGFWVGGCVGKENDFIFKGKEGERESPNLGIGE